MNKLAEIFLYISIFVIAGFAIWITKTFWPLIFLMIAMNIVNEITEDK